ncbi:MAG: YraN family protein [Candidatus Nanopelagicales bacterium]
MTNRSKLLGDWGEKVAQEHLKNDGYEILTSNWRCSIGELDVVAKDSETIVACEVKTRTSAKFGTPLEAIGKEKAKRLKQLLYAYLFANSMKAKSVRIDIVGWGGSS